jgi:hypothetical protein
MRLRWSALFLSLSSFLITCASTVQGQHDSDPVPDFLFQRRPSTSACTVKAEQDDRYHLVSPPAPGFRKYTHLAQLTLLLAEVPAMTITADGAGGIQISGGSTDSWALGFCAEADGKTEEEANGYLKRFTMTRTGGTVSLAGPEMRAPDSSQASVIVGAPASAPLVVNGYRSSVEIRDMAGPVTVSTTESRITVLDTTGSLFANGGIVDFAGSKGKLRLDALTGINLKIRAQHFDGTVWAEAHGDLHLLVPRGFKTAFVATVQQPKNFICRADFCSKVSQQQTSFGYAGDGHTRPMDFWLRSDQKIVIDNAN